MPAMSKILPVTNRWAGRPQPIYKFSIEKQSLCLPWRPTETEEFQHRIACVHHFMARWSNPFRDSCFQRINIPSATTQLNFIRHQFYSHDSPWYTWYMYIYMIIWYIYHIIIYIYHIIIYIYHVYHVYHIYISCISYIIYIYISYTWYIYIWSTWYTWYIYIYDIYISCISCRSYIYIYTANAWALPGPAMTTDNASSSSSSNLYWKSSVNVEV